MTGVFYNLQIQIHNTNPPLSSPSRHTSPHPQWLSRLLITGAGPWAARSSLPADAREARLQVVDGETDEGEDDKEDDDDYRDDDVALHHGCLVCLFVGLFRQAVVVRVCAEAVEGEVRSSRGRMMGARVNSG